MLDSPSLEAFWHSFPLQQEASGRRSGFRQRQRCEACRPWGLVAALIQLPGEAQPAVHFIRCSCTKKWRL